MSIILSIAAGGAVGAIGRYLTMEGVNYCLGSGFPYATLIVNVAGSFFLGSLISLLGITWSPSAEIRGFLIVGLLGSFTTFSTFSSDVIALLEQGEFLSASLYIIVSVIFSVLALFSGILFFRHLLA
ncbi:MAG TPA: fluoride efflux transporter CrcB [Rhodospirillales bacterium]|jgi:CrcB protein|nr:fluoride efflux transporter CrcB [Rhodospirillales bacterium]HIL74211.1 fluoride efflux transporter CrcB [Rhodospirillales bacterium]